MIDTYAKAKTYIGDAILVSENEYVMTNECFYYGAVWRSKFDVDAAKSKVK